MRDPAFWWRKAGLAATLLNPFGLAYGAIAAQRMTEKGAAVGVPVLCVGNFTIGGAGKTPTAMMLARTLAEADERPFCLSRGYGGDTAGPKLVDAHADFAVHVGDEPLLLARVAPTIIARDRVAGAKLARTAGASAIILDDGLQNPSLAKDFRLAVLDGRRGIGNGCIFPAGPLRAPLATQLACIDALLVVGGGAAADNVALEASGRGLRIFQGRLMPNPGVAAALKGRNVLAFAGIGDPEKFFATVVAAGIALKVRRSFPDHHRYTAEEARELIVQAERESLALLTTEKDHARMQGEKSLAALATRTQTLPVTMMVKEADELGRLVISKVRR
ncbi:MAG TPA: tetraacyldisaccharide 4'-kinase [Pseudolabrys sp.]|nr:tetraacyldisaccharide 4'-kinase [Pseudolabrys sp.]